MNVILSGRQLDDCLADIKYISDNYDFDRLKKLVFLNTDSFLNYFDTSSDPGISGRSFSEVLHEIEPFIPLILSEDCMTLYVQTLIDGTEEDQEAIRQNLVKNAKVLFVKNVFHARSDEAVEEIFEICRRIRDYKEFCGGGVPIA